MPEEGLHDPEVLQKGRTAVVLELLRKGAISQGRAAEVLEINRYVLFDLMATHEIPAIQLTEQELGQEADHTSAHTLHPTPDDRCLSHAVRGRVGFLG